jgi:hypothetical protein
MLAIALRRTAFVIGDLVWVLQLKNGDENEESLGFSQVYPSVDELGFGGAIQICGIACPKLKVV